MGPSGACTRCSTPTSLPTSARSPTSTCARGCGDPHLHAAGQPQCRGPRARAHYAHAHRHAPQPLPPPDGPLPSRRGRPRDPPPRGRPRRLGVVTSPPPSTPPVLDRRPPLAGVGG